MSQKRRDSSRLWVRGKEDVGAKSEYEYESVLRLALSSGIAGSRIVMINLDLERRVFGPEKGHIWRTAERSVILRPFVKEEPLQFTH